MNTKETEDTISWADVELMQINGLAVEIRDGRAEVYDPWKRQFVSFVVA